MPVEEKLVSEFSVRLVFGKKKIVARLHRSVNLIRVGDGPGSRAVANFMGLFGLFVHSGWIAIGIPEGTRDDIARQISHGDADDVAQILVQTARVFPYRLGCFAERHRA